MKLLLLLNLNVNDWKMKLLLLRLSVNDWRMKLLLNLNANDWTMKLLLSVNDWKMKLLLNINDWRMKERLNRHWTPLMIQLIRCFLQHLQSQPYFPRAWIPSSETQPNPLQRRNKIVSL